MTKVSVIIPVYNSSKYLKKCLDSVCNQSLEDIEIILVNDASTDNSLDIIKYYEKNDSRIKLIDMVVNTGPGVSRNIGISFANGEYIGFVDSDDYIDSNMYYELYNKMMQYDVDMVTCGFIKEICGIDYKKILCKSNGSLQEDCIIEPQKNPQIVSEESVSCWNKLYKHDFIEKFSFPENLKFEDYPTTINMLGSANSIFSIDRNLYHYRIRPNSITTADHKNFKLDTLDIFECNDQIRKYYTENRLLSIFDDNLKNIFLIHSVSKLSPMLSIDMSYQRKKELINYFYNLLDIEFGDWQNDEYFLKKKASSIMLGPYMNILNRFFLDDSLRYEKEKEKVKEKIIELCNEESK